MTDGEKRDLHSVTARIQRGSRRAERPPALVNVRVGCCCKGGAGGRGKGREHRSDGENSGEKWLSAARSETESPMRAMQTLPCEET